MGQNTADLGEAMQRAEIGQASWDDQIRLKDEVESLRAAVARVRGFCNDCQVPAVMPGNSAIHYAAGYQAARRDILRILGV